MTVQHLRAPSFGLIWFCGFSNWETRRAINGLLSLLKCRKVQKFGFLRKQSFSTQSWWHFYDFDRGRRASFDLFQLPPIPKKVFWNKTFGKHSILARSLITALNRQNFGNVFRKIWNKQFLDLFLLFARVPFFHPSTFCGLSDFSERAPKILRT